MMKKIVTAIAILATLAAGYLAGISRSEQSTLGSKPAIKYDDTVKLSWDQAFREVQIPSSIDSEKQKAYFYATTASTPMPLVVSLHTWSSDYTQKDTISVLAKNKNWNYIHPDFRGRNVRPEACCSKYVTSDIDDAISYAIRNAHVDTNAIYVMGASGGGMATLNTFMKSKHRIKKFSAWVPVTDLKKFYDHGIIMKNKYPKEVIACTDSLNEQELKSRSPLYQITPVEKLSSSKILICAGVYDGLQGSVPISSTINFYNKILKDLKVTDQKYYVSDLEKAMLYNQSKPEGDFGSVGGREVFLRKEYKNITLIIFKGNHEMLPEFAFENLEK